MVGPCGPQASVEVKLDINSKKHPSRDCVVLNGWKALFQLPVSHPQKYQNPLPNTNIDPNLVKTKSTAGIKELHLTAGVQNVGSFGASCAGQAVPKHWELGFVKVKNGFPSE